MEGLWIIIVIVVLVFRVLNKAGEITGEMKERLPEVLGEKQLPTVFKDWGFPWEEDDEGDGENRWGEYAKAPEKGVDSLRNTVNNTVIENPMEDQTGIILAANTQTRTELQPEKEAGLPNHPLLDSESIVNGIILSELLQPPKAKRLGRRFR